MRGATIIAAAVAVGLVAGEDLQFSKVHVVDRIGDNWLFRSNMPVVNYTFAYAELTSYFQSRAQSEANATFPADFFLNIHSLDNWLESNDTQYEVDWAAANPQLGNVSFWPLVGQLLPPALVSAAERQALATNNTALWGIDLLPTRMPALRAMLEQTYDIPHVFLFHCEAGCDRTGEFAAAWYMQYKGMNATAAFALDTTDCGRAPNYWAKNAIQWYCLTLEVQLGMQLGDCINW